MIKYAVHQFVAKLMYPFSFSRFYTPSICPRDWLIFHICKSFGGEVKFCPPDCIYLITTAQFANRQHVIEKSSAQFSSTFFPMQLDQTSHMLEFESYAHPCAPHT